MLRQSLRMLRKSRPGIGQVGILPYRMLIRRHLQLASAVIPPLLFSFLAMNCHTSVSRKLNPERFDRLSHERAGRVLRVAPPAGVLRFQSTSELAAQAHKRPPLAVLLVGQHHGDEVPYTSGPGWFALVAEGNTSRLESVRLRVRYFWDPLIDRDKKGPYSGKAVSAEPPLNAVVLLQDGVLHPGPIATASISGKRRGLSSKEFALGNRFYSLRVDHDCGKSVRRCRWMLSDGRIHQTLAEFDVTRTPEGQLDTDSVNTGVIWAGDLDNDGRLDLIVDVSNNYNEISNIVVFLSSFAEEGQLVGPTGRFSAVGC